MMKLITEELLDTVTSQAKENSRLRMNYNFHASMDAPIHRLLNALEPGTYLPPHRHTDKEETYLVLRGSLLAFFYDDAGNVTDKVCLNPSEGKYGLEIPSNTWHSIIISIRQDYNHLIHFGIKARMLLVKLFINHIV